MADEPGAKDSGVGLTGPQMTAIYNIINGLVGGKTSGSSTTDQSQHGATTSNTDTTNTSVTQ